MGNNSENFDIEDLISYGEDLINLLNITNGFEIVSQSYQHLNGLDVVCEEDFNQIQGSIEDCRKKVDACKTKLEEEYSDVADGDEIERLEKEIDEEMELECKLKNELRVVADELENQNTQRTLIQEKRQSIKRNESDDLRAEKRLSMYASVTKVIPYFDDPSKISGYMVDKEKKVIEKFRFETNKKTAYETCNSIWNIINQH